MVGFVRNLCAQSYRGSNVFLRRFGSQINPSPLRPKIEFPLNPGPNHTAKPFAKGRSFSSQPKSTTSIRMRVLAPILGLAASGMIIYLYSSQQKLKAKLDEAEAALNKDKLSKEPKETLTFEQLKEIGSKLGVPFSGENNPSAEVIAFYQQACFQAAFQACLDGKWNDSILPIQHLLQHLRDRWGRTLFLYAVSLGKEDCVIEFLTRNLYLFVHQTDFEGNNGLHYAASNGYRFVETLLKHFFVNGTNDKGQTPLHQAILKGHRHIVELLLWHGANRNLLVEDKGIKQTAVALAVSCGESECLDVLLQGNEKEIQKALSIHMMDVGSLLHLAIRFRQPKILLTLAGDLHLYTKGLLSSKDSEGRTPLQLACFLGDLEALNILWNMDGIDVNAKDDQGRTCVHWAALGAQGKVIEVLADKGVPLEVGDSNGQTATNLLQKNISDAKNATCLAILRNCIEKKPRVENSPPNFVENPAENIVICGGGSNGIAHIGALKGLKKHHALDEVVRVAGTSAGATVAALYAIGYTPEELESELSNVDMDSFLDYSDPIVNASFRQGKFDLFVTILKEYWGGGKALTTNPIARAEEFFRRIYTTTGLCEGKVFHDWIEKKIAEKYKKPNMTLGELHELARKDHKKYKDLHVYVTVLNTTGLPEVLCVNSEDRKFDNVVISHLIRASISIPFVFEPHTLYYIDPADLKRTAYTRSNSPKLVDGGLLRNAPWDAFDDNKFQSKEQWGMSSNRRTLGLLLVQQGEEDQAVGDVKNAKDLIYSILRTFYHAEQILSASYPHNAHRILKIPIKRVPLTQFKLPPAKNKEFIQDSENAVDGFFLKP